MRKIKSNNIVSQFILAKPTPGGAIAICKKRAIKLIVIGLLSFGIFLVFNQLINTATIAKQQIPNHQPSSIKSPGVSKLNSNSQNQTVIATSAHAALPKQNVPKIPAAPICTNPGVLPVPSLLSLASGSSGLQQVIEQPYYYQIFGYTASDVSQQLKNCSPANDGGIGFAASTNYSIDWRFDYNIDNDNCLISNVAVGVNIQQTFPNWNNSKYAQVNLAGSWQQFANNLQIHENGHRDLDLQYAAKIYNDLKNIPSTSCESIEQAANGTASADIALLNQANQNYDTITGHGTSQNAVFQY